jgi:hypothetical protein
MRKTNSVRDADDELRRQHGRARSMAPLAPLQTEATTTESREESRREP